MKQHKEGVIRHHEMKGNSSQQARNGSQSLRQLVTSLGTRKHKIKQAGQCMRDPHSSSLDLTSKVSSKIPVAAGEQVFKHVSLWGAFYIHDESK